MTRGGRPTGLLSGIVSLSGALGLFYDMWVWATGLVELLVERVGGRASRTVLRHVGERPTGSVKLLCYHMSTGQPTGQVVCY